MNRCIRSRSASWRAGALWTAMLVALLAANSDVEAQTNPNVVEFLPSAEHSVVLSNGQPAVTRYEFLVYQTGSLDAYLRLDMGKPAPQADGVIRVDFASRISVWPLPNVSSESRVAVFGPNGVSVSNLSNGFTYSCSFGLSPTGQSFSGAGGTGSAQVTTSAQCPWTVSSSASWITVKTLTGAGSATVSYSVAANTGTTQRSGTLNIAGSTFTVTQGAASMPAPTSSSTSTSTLNYLEQNGLVVMEAEKYDAIVDRSGKSWVVRTRPSGFSGASALQSLANKGGLIDTGYVTTSPELRYQAKFSTPGTYHVWLRGRAASTSDNTVHVGLNGQAVSTADRMSLSTIGAWTWFKTTMDGPVATLSIPAAGVYTVNVWMREDGFYLDRLLLTTNSGLVPSGAGPAESGRQ